MLSSRLRFARRPNSMCHIFLSGLDHPHLPEDECLYGEHEAERVHIGERRRDRPGAQGGRPLRLLHGGGCHWVPHPGGNGTCAIIQLQGTKVAHAEEVRSETAGRLAWQQGLRHRHAQELALLSHHLTGRHPSHRKGLTLNCLCTNFPSQGTMLELKKKWWEVTGDGACSAAVGGGDQMSVAALAGLFMMLIGGMVWMLVDGWEGHLCDDFKNAISKMRLKTWRPGNSKYDCCLWVHLAETEARGRRGCKTFKHSRRNRNKHHHNLNLPVFVTDKGGVQVCSLHKLELFIENLVHISTIITITIHSWWFCLRELFLLATLVAPHLTPVSGSVGRSFGLA